ncbi:PREDICTED: uncharacterized protein LOC108610103 [Drosophila arizonae]|uniref:RING-type E3 ubiquitin transferase n=1 Tax=Drosophila arizonae TaxID=7263 RepID=A0ABM1NR52_DROAR|nr:PREDICTED: uncharacterized protein LOC108610103 [Drosophila arizonae]
MDFQERDDVANWMENEQNFVDFFYDNFDLARTDDADSTAGDADEPNPEDEQQVATIPEIRRRRRNHLLAPYFCNVCQDYVRAGVITICGHLFCWTCLWGDLHSRVLSRCPCCMRRLLLHEDIIPFLGEGPNAGADDANIVAQPGDVARPSGLYLEHQHYPIWFAVHNFEEVRFAGLRVVERNLAVTVQRMHLEYRRSMSWIKYLQWFQLACAAGMLYLWTCISPSTD